MCCSQTSKRLTIEKLHIISFKLNLIVFRNTVNPMYANKIGHFVWQNLDICHAGTIYSQCYHHYFRDAFEILIIYYVYYNIKSVTYFSTNDVPVD